jgi:aspartyl-tRNA(Asn)/glutamyl-tRNA(Gln) amidotransferase subunit A
MYKSVRDVQSAISSGSSVMEILEHYLTRIQQHQQLNAFLEVFEESARRDARRIQDKITKGAAGKLAGVVIGIKDNLCYKGHTVSASSRILENFTSLYTATSVQRLLDEDAIIIGRLNCDEFAMGSSNETSAFGPVLNYLNPDFVPGGSSGGSAVAVQAGLCTLALGSDTGGSVRQPASWTGTVGLKPTYGRISRYGLIAYASSFDQVGVFSSELDDASLLYSIMAGKDPLDATSSSQPVSQSKIAPTHLRFGIIKDYMELPGLDEEVKTAFSSCVHKLKEDGHEVKEFSFPFLDFVVPVYYVLSTAEASSNLARFDGIHFGKRSGNAEGIDDTYVNSRSEGFGLEVKRRIVTGTFVLSNEQYEAYYAKGQKVRRLLYQATKEIFSEVDCVLMPTTPSSAFKIGEVKDPIQMYLQDIFTVHANLTGNPAMNIPLSQSSNGMPFGIQLMTDHFEEELLFHASRTINDVRD